VISTESEARARSTATDDSAIGALRGHDAGDAGRGQGVALGQAVGAQQLHHLGGGVQDSGGHGRPGGLLLAGDVDHAGRAVGVQVGELLGHTAIVCLRHSNGPRRKP
jgi:hypothetical protein